MYQKQQRDKESEKIRGKKRGKNFSFSCSGINRIV